MFGLISPGRSLRPPPNQEPTSSRFLGIKRSPAQALTFHSQQDFEDKIGSSLGSAAATLPNFNPRPADAQTELDLEAGGLGLPALLSVPRAKADGEPRTKTGPAQSSAVPIGVRTPRVPNVQVTTATPPSSPPESDNEDSSSDGYETEHEITVNGADEKEKPSPKPRVRDLGARRRRPQRIQRVIFDQPQKVTFDEKESYEFLQTDGRWHGKPRVYEYNQSSARLLKTSRGLVFYTLKQKDRTKPKKCVLNVATMQALVIRTYQREIVEAGKELMDGKMSVMLPQLLHKYCTALRDMDYMEEKAANGFEGDPFLLMTSKKMERDLMQDHDLLAHMNPLGDLPSAFDEREPQLPGLGRTARLHAAQMENVVNKLYSALGGGLALIFPMIIMRLEPGTVSCLVTTSGCVLIFSLIIAFRSSMRPNEILAVTAAYTAVLVVFVGTTT